MSQDVKERWIELCEKAAVEQDPGKLLVFMKELNGLLEAKELSRRELTAPGPLPERRDSSAETATSRRTRGR